MVLDRLNAQGRGDVGLAGSWAADQNDIVRAVDEVALVQAADHGFIDLAGGEGEAGQVLAGREASRLDL
jgi:hypothetical protein